jgi:hypothetical protein
VLHWRYRLNSRSSKGHRRNGQTPRRYPKPSIKWPPCKSPHQVRPPVSPFRYTSNVLASTSQDHLAAVLTETLPVIPIPPNYSIDPPLNPNAHLNMDSPISPHSRPLSHYYSVFSISKTTGVLLDDMRSLTISLLTRLTKDPNLRTSTSFRHEFLPYQTELMSMTSESDSADDSYRGDYIYECCRLTAIIYVRSILHGIPFSQSYPKLGLQKLDRAIKQVSVNGWNRCPGVLLWVLLVQLPARRFQDDQSYYLGMLQRLGAAVGFVAWDDLIKSIECFIRVQQFVAVG